MLLKVSLLQLNGPSIEETALASVGVNGELGPKISTSLFVLFVGSLLAGNAGTSKIHFLPFSLHFCPPAYHHKLTRKVGGILFGTMGKPDSSMPKTLKISGQGTISTIHSKASKRRLAPSLACDSRSKKTKDFF